MTSSPSRRAMTRRAFLGAAVTVAAVGCSETVRETVSRVAPSSAPTSAPAPSAAPAYQPVAGEALAEAKLAAGQFAQALSNYGPDDNDEARAAIAGAGGDTAAAGEALIVPGSHSRGAVDFVQFGGLVPVAETASYASLMVLLRQSVVPRGQTGGTETVRTLDVRVRRGADGAWQVEELASIGGAPETAASPLPEAANALLANDAVVLPDSSKWDIQAGVVHTDLLLVMQQLATLGTLGVTVLRNGHPPNVIDGRRDAPVSNHTLGRAVDIHALDGVLVQQLPPPRLRELVQAAGSDRRVRQVGAPLGADLDGGGRRYFANLVHADHLHVAVGA